MLNELLLHALGGNLKLSLSESIEKDDPFNYIYKVQLLEGDDDEYVPANSYISGSNSGRRESSRAKGKFSSQNESVNVESSLDHGVKMNGSLMDARCDAMS